MRASCRAVVSGRSRIGSIASLATEPTDGEILVQLFGPNMASEAILGYLILKKLSSEVSSSVATFRAITEP